MSALALTFRIFNGDRLVREETLRQAVIKIGKVPSAHLRIEDESVSRMHAILEVDTAGTVTVIDLGSTRGTFINGHRVNKAKLESGDAITVGSMRVEVAFQRTDTVLAAPVMTAPVAPTPVAVAPVLRVAPPLSPAMPAAKPVFVKPAAAPAAESPFARTSHDDDAHAAKSIEVAAMLGDSVVAVKHCIDPRSGKVTRKTWGLFATGATCLLASAISFGVSVHTAAANKAGLDYTTHVLNRPSYAFRPEQLAPAFDWLAFGGLALGASSIIAGLARVRGERRTPFYRIGTAPGVELALDSAPTASFPLVAPSHDGEDFVFNYGAGMDGEMVLDGHSTTLAELAASGRARPSMSTAGAIELPIPARARIRARSGQTTFVVSAVAQPRQQPTSLLATFESRTAKYFAGSLLVHLCILGFISQLPADDSTATFEVASDETPVVALNGTTHEDPPPDEVKPEDGSDSGAAGQVSMKAPGEEGTAGKPDSNATDKHLTVKDNHTEPQIARDQAIQEAREAGILGTISSRPDLFTSITATGDISSDMADANFYGNIYGAEAGDAHGNFGMGRRGIGLGGGCTQEPCGLIGTGDRYNTIHGGNHAGGDWGSGGGGNPGLRRHEGGVPKPYLGQATGVGDLDQATIRRYIKRNIEKLSYCYEHELLAHPAIEGTIMAQFFITPTGSVKGSTATGFDATVARCVADVVGNIAFPPPNGGGVQVNYPFTFHAAGR